MSDDSPVSVLYHSDGTETGTASIPLRVDPTGTTTQPVSGTVGVSGTVTTTTATSATGTESNVASSATSVTLLASNASRKGWSIFNDSTQFLYVALTATASATVFFAKVYPGCRLDNPYGQLYTGVIGGIWASANGFARVTELT